MTEELMLMIWHSLALKCIPYVFASDFRLESTVFLSDPDVAVQVFDSVTAS